MLQNPFFIATLYRLQEGQVVVGSFIRQRMDNEVWKEVYLLSNFIQVLFMHTWKETKIIEDKGTTNDYQ